MKKTIRYKVFTFSSDNRQAMLDFLDRCKSSQAAKDKITNVAHSPFCATHFVFHGDSSPISDALVANMTTDITLTTYHAEESESIR